jgi:Transposase IS116/IS110/IS902 family
VLVAIVVELVDHIRAMTTRIKELTGQITTRMQRHAPQLLTLSGCGPLCAAKLLVETADVRRFKSEAAFAMHTGLAPIPVSLGRVQRHPGLRQSAVMSVSSVCQAEDGKRPGGVAAGMSQRGGEVGVAGQAQRADGEVAQAGHHPGEAAAARSGGVFAEVHVADPVQPVLDPPVPAQPARQLRGASGAKRQAGDGVHRDGAPTAAARRADAADDLDRLAACGKHRPATAATFRVRTSTRPWP